MSATILPTRPKPKMIVRPLSSWLSGTSLASASTVQLGFVEPYLFDKQILLGGDIFRKDYNSFNYIGNSRNTTYSQTSTGTAFRLGFPITEYVTLGTRYSLINDKITLDESTFFTDPDLIDPDGI